uniref:Uncharacterized protein n=1 Tax=Arundo donax TaxID=35708 RepID=A0A0A9AUJ0_ARUDO
MDAAAPAEKLNGELIILPVFSRSPHLFSRESFLVNTYGDLSFFFCCSQLDQFVLQLVLYYQLVTEVFYYVLFFTYSGIRIAIQQYP